MAEIMNENKPKKPMDYLAKSLRVYFITGLIYSLAYGGVMFLGAKFVTEYRIIATAVSVILTELIIASQAFFYFRAVHRGTPDIGDVFRVFTEKTTQKQMFTLLIAMLAIDGVINLIAGVINQPALLNTAVVIVTSVIGMLLRPVWYMFTANPHYPVKAYITYSIKYMKGNLLKYIGIVFLYVLGIRGGAVVMILRIGLMYGAASLLFALIWAVALVFILAMLDIRIALFMKNIIPDRWFAGEEQI